MKNQGLEGRLNVKKTAYSPKRPKLILSTHLETDNCLSPVPGDPTLSLASWVIRHTHGAQTYLWAKHPSIIINFKILNQFTFPGAMYEGSVSSPNPTNSASKWETEDIFFIFYYLYRGHFIYFLLFILFMYEFQVFFPCPRTI